MALYKTMASSERSLTTRGGAPPPPRPSLVLRRTDTGNWSDSGLLSHLDDAFGHGLSDEQLNATDWTPRFDDEVLEDPTSVAGTPREIMEPPANAMANRVLMGTYFFDNQINVLPEVPARGINDWQNFQEELHHFALMLRENFSDGQYGVEECPDTGRLHIQWRGRLAKRMKWRAARAMITGGGWMGDKESDFRAADQDETDYEFKGKDKLCDDVLGCGAATAGLEGQTMGDAIGYHDDHETPFYDCWGNMNGERGKRTDLEKIKEVVELSTCPTDVLNKIEEHLNPKLAAKATLQYLGNIGKYLELKNDLQNEAIQDKSCFGIPIIGPSGCGKSHHAAELALKHYEPTQIYNMPQQPEGRQVWMDGYERRHLCIIFDDFRGNQMNFVTLLQLLDAKLQRKFPKKGGFIYVVAECVIFTSVEEPKDWYPVEYCDAKTWKQLERRLTPCITDWPGKRSEDDTDDPKKRKFMEMFGFITD